MILIKPSFSFEAPINAMQMLTRIERAGRTCYKSEAKCSYRSSIEFALMLISQGHESVLEHQSFSVRFICDRGISHELVRHRIASFSQESTRYCNYSLNKFGNQLTYIIPPWFDLPEGRWDPMKSPKSVDPETYQQAIPWIQGLREAEQCYFGLLNNHLSPQKARSILPNALKTEIVVTANIREWREIFRQRTAADAHPQMRELMVPLGEKLCNIVPVLFNDVIK